MNSEDRSASFVELFFDLVFVFGITQVVASIHGHLDWPTLWRAAVVLALLWWAWSQYTWLGGYTDFEEFSPRVVLLLATAGSFVLAVAVRDAWIDDGAFFGTGYFGVMSLAGVFYWLRARGSEQMEGVLAYVPRMLAGAALVLIGGFVSGDLRSVLWVGGVAVNLVSALVAGRYEFEINAAHFAERHGLFVIIVLGEALIAIGLGTVGHDGSIAFYVGGTASLVIALSLWWAYFDWPFRTGERALRAARSVELGRLGRDAYSLGHYPLVAGVILFAVGAEEVLAHPDSVLAAGHRWALVGGLMSFVSAVAYMVWRWTRRIAWERIGLVGVLGITAAFVDFLDAAVLTAVVAAVVGGGLTIESVRREKLRLLR